MLHRPVFCRVDMLTSEQRSPALLHLSCFCQIDQLRSGFIADRVFGKICKNIAASDAVFLETVRVLEQIDDGGRSTLPMLSKFLKFIHCSFQHAGDLSMVWQIGLPSRGSLTSLA